MPDALPAKPQLIWKTLLPSGGLGGIAANDKYVILGHRDFSDFQDVFHCLDAATGKSLWKIEYLAVDGLDYGQSPRATPCIVADRVIFLGAMGDLHCVQLETGKILWHHNLKSMFAVKADMPWGYCGSPLIVGDKVVVQAGGKEASLVAFDLQTGEVVWQTAGAAPSYGSLNIGQLGGRWQIVGHDVTTLGGWDAATGKRLWSLTPPIEGDFNVPTPLILDGKLLIATENNGTRLYQFQADGTIDPTPVMQNKKLTPDMSTPVVVGNRLLCVNRFLYCLDVANQLKELSRQRDKALGDYAAMIADEQRVLIFGDGEILLVDATKDACPILARQKISDTKVDVFSHPALVGDRLFLRNGPVLQCWSLADEAAANSSQSESVSPTLP
ncbi:hypothetical protein DTL42_13605 [Bremerella cremea]|uniref:Pyrrolo-quinoline quinone repeat domain-containing protein n=1 Tax=Bremerella cremea TaxID=1031537 RepID=A0A368KSF9_9BACT|nr:PQQ-binding-like beta-propeller repeat protein [Bremerella cremea]RCS48236.1 hypothetical protein DTL42_13605 [Bremerella cremea]